MGPWAFACLQGSWYGRSCIPRKSRTTGCKWLPWPLAHWSSTAFSFSGSSFGMFSPSDSEWHDSETKPLIFAGLQPLPGPKLWRREYLCSPPGRWSQLAQKPFAKKLCSSKAMPTPWSSCYGIKFENDCKSLCKTFQLQSRTSAVDPGFLWYHARSLTLPNW